jgi:hypothetical protein
LESDPRDVRNGAEVLRASAPLVVILGIALNATVFVVDFWVSNSRLLNSLFYWGEIIVWLGLGAVVLSGAARRRAYTFIWGLACVAVLGLEAVAVIKLYTASGLSIAEAPARWSSEAFLVALGAVALSRVAIPAARRAARAAFVVLALLTVGAATYGSIRAGDIRGFIWFQLAVATAILAAAVQLPQPRRPAPARTDVRAGPPSQPDT